MGRDAAKRENLQRRACAAELGAWPKLVHGGLFGAIRLDTCPLTVPPDRFDDIRREWIAFRQGESLIQRRRAEQLGRIIRKRQRIHTVAVPDPHDDTVLPRMMWRQARSRMSKVEVAMVLVVAALVPLGWPGGWALRSVITRLIPDTLRGYPIAAWSGLVSAWAF